jgi:hypothetical protein
LIEVRLEQMSVSAWARSYATSDKRHLHLQRQLSTALILFFLVVPPVVLLASQFVLLSTSVLVSPTSPLQLGPLRSSIIP